MTECDKCDFAMCKLEKLKSVYECENILPKDVVTEVLHEQSTQGSTSDYDLNGSRMRPYLSSVS